MLTCVYVHLRMSTGDLPAASQVDRFEFVGVCAVLCVLLNEATT